MNRRTALGMGGLLVLLPKVGVAMFAQVSDAELLAHSTLVVMGTWIGQDKLALPGSSRPMPVGVVAVSEVLKGAPGTTLVFVAVPDPDALRAGSDIQYRKGDHGLWLLRPHTGHASGLYLADSPQRFVPMASAAARIQTLRETLRQGR